MDIDLLGNMLEQHGFSDDEIDDVLAHAGVKGMKWGQRKTRRIQKGVDVQRRVAGGTASLLDKTRSGLTTYTIGDVIKRRTLSEAAQKKLDVATDLQSKIANGERKATGILLKVSGIRIQDLNFSVEQ